MRMYRFSGHLNPTPAGMLPIQMSGDVYLASDVHATVKLYKDQIERMQLRINDLAARVGSLSSSLRAERRTKRKPAKRAKKRHK